MVVLIIIIIVTFIIAGIIVCLNKSHRLCVLICADVISTTSLTYKTLTIAQPTYLHSTID